MREKINFIESAKKSLEGLNLSLIKLDEGFDRISVEGGTINLDVCNTEKIEKVVFSSIQLNKMSVSEESVIVWPEDGYDLPVMWLNLTRLTGMNIAVFDFLPLMDIVVWEEYGENFLPALVSAKKRAIEAFKGEIIEKDFDLSSIVAWTLSPYNMVLQLTDAGLFLIPAVINDYCSIYTGLWKNASLFPNDEESNFCKRKKKAVRKLMKENDAGYPIMTNIFGEEITKKVFDIIF